MQKTQTPKTTTSKGLARTLLGGEGYSLAQAFSKVRSSPDLTFSIEHTEKNWFGARLEVDNLDGAGYWEFCRFSDDHFVVISDLTYVEQRSEYSPGDGLLQFHIQLSGRLTQISKGIDPVEVNGPSLLVWAQPEGVSSNIMLEPQRETGVAIFFKPSHILDNLVTSSEQIPVHLARFVLDPMDTIKYCQLPISSEVLEAALLLMQSTDRFKDLLWLNYIYAKSEELICNIVAAFDQLALAEQESYSKAEIQQFRKARDIVAKEFSPPPTIKHIAKRVGTNERKLKQGFKALFGETVFEYRNRHRMKKAMQLIEEGVAIGLVAEKVGYQHQTSFAGAFKAYYGISPKDSRKMSK